MKWRIWLLSLGITLVCVLIFAFATTQVYYDSSIDDSKKYLHVYMNGFDENLYPIDNSGAAAFSEKLDGARVTFTDAHGNVLADSATEHANADHSDRTEIIDAIKHGEGFAVRSSSRLGKNMVYYCKNFDGKFLVRIAVFTDNSWMIFVKTLPTLALFSSIMIVLCAVVAVVATHFIITPVKKLATSAASDNAVSTDISELKPVAEILNMRNRDIRRQLDEIKTEKYAAESARASKDEFISNVTHEMNTPLTSIHGYAELLAAGGLTEEQKQLAYSTVLSQSERLTNLIACIINYSEIDSDDLPSYDTDFSALAKEILQALKPEADKRGITVTENIKDGVTISSRHERLSEVFGNLVRNAIKYNKDGGSITVTLDEHALVVEDSGIGIAAENMNKVFSRFFTVDKSHGGKNGGFGLGLAVVKKICTKSGWDINVESELGAGSKFTVGFDS